MPESVQTQAYYSLEIYSYSIYTCVLFSNEESGEVQRTAAAFIFAHYRNTYIHTLGTSRSDDALAGKKRRLINSSSLYRHFFLPIYFIKSMRTPLELNS